MRKPEPADVAKELLDRLQGKTGALIGFDETGNLGKRYRRDGPRNGRWALPQVPFAPG